MNNRHNCYNQKHQLLARAADAAWGARNTAGELVDKLRSEHAPAADIDAAMSRYLQCRAIENQALDALEAA